VPKQSQFSLLYQIYHTTVSFNSLSDGLITNFVFPTHFQYPSITPHLKCLQRTQNQLVSVVCKAPYRSSATDLLRQLHWLPVTQRIDYKILTIVYVVRQRRQPKYLLDLLTDYAPV